MKSQEQVLQILEEFKVELRKVYGSRLSDVLLFGSYASNEQQEESDVDVLVVLDDLKRNERWSEYDFISEIIQDVSLKNDIFLSVKLRGKQVMSDISNIFLRNVLSESLPI